MFDWLSGFQVDRASFWYGWFSGIIPSLLFLALAVRGAIKDNQQMTSAGEKYKKLIAELDDTAETYSLMGMHTDARECYQEQKRLCDEWKKELGIK